MERNLGVTRRCWFALSVGLTLVVVAWEYLLSAWTNPDVSWSLVGVAAHMTLDWAMLLPVLTLALVGGTWLCRRLGMGLADGAGADGAGADSAGLLGTVGTVSMVFLMAALPVTSTRDLAHEWMGQTYGFSLAEVQTTVVRTDLTVQQATQLCSFGSVRNPSLAREDYQSFEVTVLTRLRAGFSDSLIQQAAFLPLLLLGLFLVSRERFPRWRLSRWRLSRWRLSRWRMSRWLPDFPEVSVFTLTRALITARPARLASLVGIGAFALLCVGYGTDQPGVSMARASIDAGLLKNACVDGAPVKEYNISAIDVTITLNRWGDHVKQGQMYALDANIPAIRDFEAALDLDRDVPDDFDNNPTRVSFGLRKDPIQPLAIRANVGECLRIHFTNDLGDGNPAGMNILGLPHTVENAGNAVGENASSLAAPGETVTYEIPIPDDPDAERAYHFADSGVGRQRQNMGLFGAIVVEPKGATYLDVETGEPLDTVTGSNWEAIIIDPNLDGRADAKSFREFVIFYHEIGDEAFTDIRDKDQKKIPLVDEIAGVYRPAARALNYRSEPFRRRLEQDKLVNGKQAGGGKSQGYNSYSFGDPATPIPRSYLGEATKTRLMHGGSEIFHVHHLHGGADRWRRNPNSDPNNDYWKGLTKVPDPNLSSIHLDSQSIGPGSSYNLEHECGAGGCQQGVGEFLFHCHIGHHYISGMWSFWRVFGTEQTAETNVNGAPLYVESRLHQSESTLQQTTPPDAGVSAGELLGLVVDDGKVLSAGPTTAGTKNLLEWIQQMIPPSGVPTGPHDATVWNWTYTGSGGDLQIWGEPESEDPFPGWVSKTPGVRPEVRFNPKNGRYTWPLFRPQNSRRPPFTARHTGAPWLGETMKEGRLDGLCATPDLVPEIGPGALQRYYPVSAITLPIQVTPDREDPDGMIFVLNEHERDVRRGKRPTEPLAVRSNVGDCVEILFTNKIPDGPLNKDFSKVNIHSHFVQFDTQASDGVMTGFSYEQSVRPTNTEQRWLTQRGRKKSTSIVVNHIDGLHPELVEGGGKGVWIGIGLGEATCGIDERGQPLPCTEIRQITGFEQQGDGDWRISFEQPLRWNHTRREAVGVEFVRYNWFSDVDFGTVFFHQHVEFKDWDRGLFGAHVVEPKGSTYHDPLTGEEVRAGTLVDVRVDPSAGGNPVAHGVQGSFREFMLFLHNQSPAEGQFSRGGGTINLRAEPWRLREGEPAHRFSSVTHGDPWTQKIRAYVGDPVVIRGLGLVERVGGVRFTGHRFDMERYNDKSDTRDTTFIGISERFDFSLKGGAGGVNGYPGDYLYYSTLGKDFESGAWGMLRAYDTLQGSLKPLPDRERPGRGRGFPSLSQTGGAPPSLGDGPGNICPVSAPRREYSIAIGNRTIVYNDEDTGDRRGVVYHLQSDVSDEARTPLVMRVNVGDCLVLDLVNERDIRSSISVGEMPFDPQRSYGSAIGYNYDSTVEAGGRATYEYYADSELGIVLALNLGDIDSVEVGAFGAVVVEPAGSQYFRPGLSDPLPGGGTGVQADIVTDGVLTREMVTLFNDQDRRIGASAMPYPDAIENFNGINYSAEPLKFRGLFNRPADVFKSSEWGDPRHVVTVPTGTPLTFRVAQPWGNQLHVPTLEGHRFPQEPGMVGSEVVFNDALAPGMSLNFHFMGGVGGEIQAPGDYLFLDRRMPFLEGGMWLLLRATGDGTSGSTDAIAVLASEKSATGGIVLRGWTTMRPAGDFAQQVMIHAGDAVDGACRGKPLGTAKVDSGSGRWTFEQDSGTPLEKVCIASSAGGVYSNSNVFEREDS